MGRPTIPDVRKVTTSSKSALSYRPVTQVGSGGLAQAIGAKAIVRETRIHAIQCRRFIGHDSGTPTWGSVSNLLAFASLVAYALGVERNQQPGHCGPSRRRSRSATLDGSHSLGARY